MSRFFTSTPQFHLHKKSLRRQFRRGASWTTAGLLVLLATHCTWVSITESGREVRLVASETIADCQEVGKTTSIVLDRVLFIDRSATRVAEELVTLAQNQAAELDGNRIVAASPIERGRQTFDVYRCR